MTLPIFTSAALAVGLLIPAPATASAEPAPCTPADAWSEQIVNPDYTPATPDTITTVDHPAVTVDHPAVTVDHPAVIVEHPAVVIVHPAVTIDHEAIPETSNVTGYIKWVWTGGRTDIAPAFTGEAPWNLTSDNRPNKHDPIDTVYKTGKGKNASWAIYISQIEYIPGVPAWTETISEEWTETVTEAWTETVTEAWTETITDAWTETVTEAWTETITTPGDPAVGDPFIVVEHDAVVCDTPGGEVEPAPKPETPAAVKPATAPPVAPMAQAKELALTGAPDLGWLILLGLTVTAGGFALARRTLAGEK